PLRIGKLALEIAAHGLGKGRILDAQHDLHVDVEAAIVEVRRADVDDIVDDRELGMELRRLVFIHLDVAAEQAAVAVPRSGDGRVVVRLGRGDDPRAPAPPEAPETPKHRAGRCEISEDHVQLSSAADVAADGPPPAVAHAQWTAELPL